MTAGERSAILGSPNFPRFWSSKGAPRTQLGSSEEAERTPDSGRVSTSIEEGVLTMLSALLEFLGSFLSMLHSGITIVN